MPSKVLIISIFLIYLNYFVSCDLNRWDSNVCTDDSIMPVWREKRWRDECDTYVFESGRQKCLDKLKFEIKKSIFCCKGYKEKDNKCLPHCSHSKKNCEDACGHGECIAPDVCKCREHYYGSRCDKYCDGNLECENNNCKCVTSLELKMKSLNENNEELKENLNQLKNDKENMKFKINELNDDKIEMNQKIRDHEKSKNELETILRQLKNDKENMKLEIDELNNYKVKMDLKIKEHEDGKFELETNLNQLKNDKENLELKINELNDHKIKINEKIIDVENHNTKLKDSVLELAVSRENLNEHLNLIRDDKNKLSKRIVEINDKIENNNRNWFILSIILLIAIIYLAIKYKRSNKLIKSIDNIELIKFSNDYNQNGCVINLDKKMVSKKISIIENLKMNLDGIKNDTVQKLNILTQNYSLNKNRQSNEFNFV